MVQQRWLQAEQSTAVLEVNRSAVPDVSKHLHCRRRVEEVITDFLPDLLVRGSPVLNSVDT